MIRFVGFDLDDTLYNSTNLITLARMEGLKKMQECGLDFNLRKGIMCLNAIVHEFGSNYTRHFDILLERFKSNSYHFEIRSIDFSIPKFVAAGVMGYHEVKINKIRPFQDVKSVFQQLQELEYKIFLISDGLAVKQYEKLLRLDIAQYFDNIFISEEIGLSKPDLAFYNHVIETIGGKPSDIVYVGDRVDYDIIPAKKSGLKTILIHRGGKYDPSSMKQNMNEKMGADYEISSLTELVPILKGI